MGQGQQRPRSLGALQAGSSRASLPIGGFYWGDSSLPTQELDGIAHLLRQIWHYSHSSKHPGGLDSFFYEAGREFGKRMAVVAANPRPRHGRCPISRTGGDKMMGNHSPLSPRGRAVAPGSPVQTPGSQHLGYFPGVPGTATLSLDSVQVPGTVLSPSCIQTHSVLRVPHVVRCILRTLLTAGWGGAQPGVWE